MARETAAKEPPSEKVCRRIELGGNRAVGGEKGEKYGPGVVAGSLRR